MGMSGGMAYVLDVRGDFETKCNLGLVDLEPLVDHEDLNLVRDLVARHQQRTGSTVAADVLADWTTSQGRFVKVMPRDYKRVLQAEARAKAEAREPAFAELIGAAY